MRTALPRRTGAALLRRRPRPALSTAATAAPRAAVQRLDVYVDFKSPHAYLALMPTMTVAADYDVAVNWLPYELSYVGLGVTTTVEEDRQRRPPDAAADGGKEPVVLERRGRRAAARVGRSVWERYCRP